MYCFGNNMGWLGSYAWYAKNSGHQDKPVAQKKPNAYGFYDMHGGVWELCMEDFSHVDFPDYDASSLVKGGSYLAPGLDCRSSSRKPWGLEVGYHDIGFRVAASVNLE